MSLITKIGKKGIIKGGPHEGFFVRIEDDSQNTGGFLILTWKDNPATGYDHWVENSADLDPFIREAGWNVEWLE